MLTDQQRAIADLMLVGSDTRVVAQRLGMTQVAVQRELAAMRTALGVETHQACMAELRRMTRQPLKLALEMCRKEPRTWCRI